MLRVRFVSTAVFPDRGSMTVFLEDADGLHKAFVSLQSAKDWLFSNGYNYVQGSNGLWAK